MIREIITRAWPIIVIGLMVFFQCVLFLRRGDYWMALTYSGYVIANIGLIAVATTRTV
jgi:hypothetical protein